VPADPPRFRPDRVLSLAADPMLFPLPIRPAFSPRSRPFFPGSVAIPPRPGVTFSCSWESIRG
jgi:hypothetical protein